MVVAAPEGAAGLRLDARRIASDPERVAKRAPYRPHENDVVRVMRREWTRDSARHAPIRSDASDSDDTEIHVCPPLFGIPTIDAY